MREFTTIAELAATIGLPLGEHGTGFPAEADWIVRACGLGLPGGNHGGWLVTYVHPDTPEHYAIAEAANDTGADGWLVGYAIDENDRKTGRCVLLAGPWTSCQDKDFLRQAERESWWEANVQGKVRTNIIALDGWLQRQAG